MGTTIFITKVGCPTLKPVPDIFYFRKKKSYFPFPVQPLPAMCDEVVDRRKGFSYDYLYDSTNKGNATYASQEKVSLLTTLSVLSLNYSFVFCTYE